MQQIKSLTLFLVCCIEYGYGHVCCDSALILHHEGLSAARPNQDVHICTDEGAADAMKWDARQHKPQALGRTPSPQVGGINQRRTTANFFYSINI